MAPTTFDEAMSRFRSESSRYDAARRDGFPHQVARMNFLLDQMFTRMSADAPSRLVSGEPAAALDSGDAYPGVFPAFHQAYLRNLGGAGSRLQRYAGAEPDPGLADAVRRFLTETGFLPQRPRSPLRVLVGHGTVELYNAVCATLCWRRPDSVMLLPDLGYGFFTTQPERHGGRVVSVPTDRYGQVDPATLERTIVSLAGEGDATLGFLHIQPSVSGRVYSRAHVDEIADVLRAHRVTPVEDIAYHSIRGPLADCPTLLDRGLPTFSLFGLSKPMALADVRVGVLLMSGDVPYESVHRALESQSGFVSTVLQESLAQALVADDFSAYRVSRDPVYEGNYRAVEAALASSPAARSYLEPDVARVCARLPELAPAGTGFLCHGLGRWLSLKCRPEVGFFVLVGTEQLTRGAWRERVGTRHSYDVYLLLRILGGVRTIPGEAMGLDSDRQELRWSFSMGRDAMIENFLRVYAVLEQCDQRLVARRRDDDGDGA